MKKLRLTVCMIFLLMSYGCKTTESAAVDRARQKEAQESLRSVAGAIRGKPLSDEEAKKLGRQLRTDPEARSAVESITGAMGQQGQSINYCPVDGKRYAPSLKECPEHHVPLKDLDE